jgi:hypothetical protein
MLKLCPLTAAILDRPLKPVSQFKTNMAWMVLKSGQFSKLCLVTLTSIQDGHLQQT